jgi:hypothetical protein
MDPSPNDPMHEDKYDDEFDDDDDDDGDHVFMMQHTKCFRATSHLPILIFYYYFHILFLVGRCRLREDGKLL